MATLSMLVAAQLPNPALQPLLQQLQPNSAPPPPSVWPLAMGYWLILFVLCAAVLLIGYLYYRGRLARQWRRQLKQVQQSADALTRCHEFLRSFLILQLGVSKDLNEQQLAERVEATLGYQPRWLNAHYKQPKHTEQQQNENLQVDWSEVTLLIKRWLKETKR